MVKAVFLDRDGTINKSVVRRGLPYPPDNLSEFEFLPGSEEACRILKEASFLLVVATNQPDVGRGTVKRETVESMNSWMQSKLPIDRVEVCYDSGAEPSEFRKPKPGMLLHAANQLGIDLAASWMVGDRWRDIDCGYAAGCRTIFIDNGYAEELREHPHFRVNSLLEAARLICREAPCFRT